MSLSSENVARKSIFRAYFREPLDSMLGSDHDHDPEDVLR